MFVHYGTNQYDLFLHPAKKGHIGFFFRKEKIAFTGDTLFSLGCGRVFEGTHEEIKSIREKKINNPSLYDALRIHKLIEKSIISSKKNKRVSIN